MIVKKTVILTDTRSLCSPWHKQLTPCCYVGVIGHPQDSYLCLRYQCLANDEQHTIRILGGGGGDCITSSWFPLGNFIEGQEQLLSITLICWIFCGTCVIFSVNFLRFRLNYSLSHLCPTVSFSFVFVYFWFGF